MLGIISTLLLLIAVIYLYVDNRKLKNNSRIIKEKLIRKASKIKTLEEKKTLLKDDLLKLEIKLKDTHKISVLSHVFNDYIYKGTQDNKYSLESLATHLDEIALHAVDTGRYESQGIENLERLITKNLETANAINEVSSDIKELKNFASKINTITEKIDAVAEQTNLLALNASIEAARAGEAGKGFAVVATEIRILAEDVSNATKEIDSLIQTIVNKTETTSKSMQRTEASLDGQNLAVSETYQSFVKAQSENEIAVKGIEFFKENIDGIKIYINKKNKAINKLQRTIDRYEKIVNKKNNEILSFNERFNELNSIILKDNYSSS